ncbi:MAG: trypsin-like peptidase domain-containing protein [Deltaproteobacteria bacterium]|nr:trypsin-like peptidase domain-containing protein [Deltaproteobacteria bacterium]
MRSHGQSLKAKAFGVLLLSHLLAGAYLFADASGSAKLYPFPVVEAEEALSNWLKNHGFEVWRTSAEVDQVRLIARKGKETWQVVLKPHSPLASQVEAQYTKEGKPDPVRLEELWLYLQGYSKDPSKEEVLFPKREAVMVAPKRDSVVCIKAWVGNNPVQFSGFIIDRKGLIISTAHDLQGAREITVILKNGQEIKGRLVRRDTARDLTLIAVSVKLNSFIPLSGGRSNIRIGEKVYMVACSVHDQGKINEGVIEGPLRQADNLPLWQVAMKTLPGSSGSPVFDAKGNLVGMVKGRYRGTDSVGFLIPTETVIEFLKE